MLRIVLVRPGATDFDDQGRIKGTLDLPLNDHGQEQIAHTANETAGLEIDAIYSAPCQAALDTAAAIASRRQLKVKTLDQLRNLDHGLWQGRLIEEVRQTQPKVYRQWQEHPESVCPPAGETLSSAQQRIQDALKKLAKRYRNGIVALVVPEPLASVVECYVEQKEVGDIWKAECDCGRWQIVDLEPVKVAVS